MEIPQILQRKDYERPCKKDPVEPVFVFRNLTPSDTINIPELEEKRKCTDVNVLFIFIAALICFVISSAYIAATSDIRVTISGRDKCKNVCGIKNTVNYSKSCPAKDYTNYPILNVSESICIEEDQCKAENLKVFIGRCISLTSDSIKNDSGMDLEFWKSAEKWNPNTIIVCVVMVIVASVLALPLFYLYWYTPNCAIKSSLIFSFLLQVVTCSYLWYVVSLGQDLQHSHWDRFVLSMAIGVTLLIIVISGHTCYRYETVRLLIPLYRESLAAILVSKILFIVPIVVLIEIFLSFCWIYLILSAISVPVSKDSSLPTDRIIYLVFLILMGYWIFNFFHGCRRMIMEGKIASYYFSRNGAAKTSQYSYFKSLRILFRFHLGTVASGSFLITIMQFVMAVCTFKCGSENKGWNHFLKNCPCYRRCSLWCEEMLSYFNAEAYILTAIHGKSFYLSGKRVMRLKWTNFLDVISLKELNVAVQIYACLIIVFISLLIGFAILWKEEFNFIVINLILGLYLVVLSLYHIFSILEISIATILICYCEDRNLNDGSREKPYYMSEELKNTITEALRDAAKEKEPA